MPPACSWERRGRPSSSSPPRYPFHHTQPFPSNSTPHLPLPTWCQKEQTSLHSFSLGQQQLAGLKHPQITKICLLNTAIPLYYSKQILKQFEEKRRGRGGKTEKLPSSMYQLSQLIPAGSLFLSATLLQSEVVVLSVYGILEIYKVSRLAPPSTNCLTSTKSFCLGTAVLLKSEYIDN